MRGGDWRTTLGALTEGHGQLVDALLGHLRSMARVGPSQDVRVRPVG